MSFICSYLSPLLAARHLRGEGEGHTWAFPYSGTMHRNYRNHSHTQWLCICTLRETMLMPAAAQQQQWLCLRTLHESMLMQAASCIAASYSAPRSGRSSGPGSPPTWGRTSSRVAAPARAWASSQTCAASYGSLSLSTRSGGCPWTCLRTCCT